MIEIGSEYWIDESQLLFFEKNKELDINWISEIGEDRTYLLLGRTAINYVLKDINLKVSNVYMPSYCCSSMLQPFYDNGIAIDFYDVILTNKGLKYNINLQKDCDIFFAMSYFGFSSSNMDEEIMHFKNRNVTVIEDITHSFLSKKIGSIHSDYYVASLRKWFAIPSGGIAIKLNGKFSRQNLLDSSEIIIDKIRAMVLKNEYINSYNPSEETKKLYLQFFKKFNQTITKNYVDYDMDVFSKNLLSKIDIDYEFYKRIENAKYLEKSLKKFDFIKPLFEIIDINIDCPLFYPIKLEHNVRDRLHSFLIKKKIYCPIHWPIPINLKLDKTTTDVYDSCLSIICDPRYNLDDMSRIVYEIGEFSKIIC